MKSLKLAAFALAFGIFAASCGGNKEAESAPVDTTAAAPETPAEVAPAAPVAADTTPKTETPAAPATDTPVKK